MGPYFIQRVWFIFIIIYLPIVLDFTRKNPLNLAIRSLAYFEHFITFFDKMFQVHHVVFMPQPRISHSSMRLAWFFLLENSLEEIKSEGKCAHCYWGIVTRSSQWIALVNTRRTHTHTRTHAYLSIFLYLCIYIENHKFTLILPILAQYHKLYSSFLPFHIYNSFPIMRHLLPLFLYIYWFYQPLYISLS